MTQKTKEELKLLLMCATGKNENRNIELWLPCQPLAKRDGVTRKQTLGTII